MQAPSASAMGCAGCVLHFLPFFKSPLRMCVKSRRIQARKPELLFTHSSAGPRDQPSAPRSRSSRQNIRHHKLTLLLPQRICQYLMLQSSSPVTQPAAGAADPTVVGLSLGRFPQCQHWSPSPLCQQSQSPALVVTVTAAQLPLGVGWQFALCARFSSEASLIPDPTPRLCAPLGRL